MAADCSNLKTGLAYCVEIDRTKVPTTTSKTSITSSTSSSTVKPPTQTPSTTTKASSTSVTSTATTTKPTNGIATPSPLQQTIVDNCDAFYFVPRGEGCETVASKNGISVAELFKFNPSIGSDCSTLWGDAYACVSIIGHTPTTTTTKPTNGIPTPTPLQATIVDNCDAFYFVPQGENCETVASKNGITVAELQKFNPSIGSTCGGLWGNAYACVSIVGHTPTTTKPGNGITTPAPAQATMVDNCDAFYFVKPQEGCEVVASKNGITVAELIKFNPSAGSGCNGLWANAYACVSIIGHTPTPVNPGNGVTTPQPIQSGMVSNCKTFHFVDGQTCQQILDKYKITLANFVKWNPGVGSGCNSLWAKAYACVAVL